MAYYDDRTPSVKSLTEAIAAREKEIERLCASLGRLYYDGHNRDPKAEGATFIGAINTLKEEIERYQEEIRRIKDVRRCSRCGATLLAGAAFCTGCGAPAPTAPGAPVAPPVSQRLCPICGKAVNSDNQFCNFCGAKMD